MATEQQIKLAAKLYKCRDTAKALYREDFVYFEKIGVYQKYIKAAMAKHKLDCEITATMKLIEELGDKAEGMATVMLLAACVELIEPTTKKG